MNLLFAVVFIFILNIPFGYWRANVKKFSLQWALAIHIPVPFVVAIRVYSNIGFELYTYPILIAAFFTGQFLGAKIYSNRKENFNKYLSSCLIMDLIRSGLN